MTKLIALDGAVFALSRVGENHGGCITGDRTCCGCDRPSGEEHDPGCIWEPCPRCGFRLGSCECEWNHAPVLTDDEALATAERLLAALTRIGAAT